MSGRNDKENRTKENTSWIRLIIKLVILYLIGVGIGGRGRGSGPSLS